MALTFKGESMSLTQEFFNLFKGSDIAHGTFVVKSNRKTQKETCNITSAC